MAGRLNPPAQEISPGEFGERDPRVWGEAGARATKRPGKKSFRNSMGLELLFVRNSCSRRVRLGYKSYSMHTMIIYINQGSTPYYIKGTSAKSKNRSPSYAIGTTMKRMRLDSNGDKEEIPAESSSRKLCDDLLEEIFSRLPARSAARCAALSKRWREFINAPDFWLQTTVRRRRPALASPTFTSTPPSATAATSRSSTPCTTSTALAAAAAAAPPSRRGSSPAPATVCSSATSARATAWWPWRCRGCTTPGSSPAPCLTLPPQRRPRWSTSD